ncbi:hypothetical protein C8E08_0471 [Paracidovorax citrulli]|nr:hypothetical protein C8E08_0471 [Paracidovorax citrulli]REG67829.1 hypothetical protein C8E07_0916 [Paracidovorax citrulli]RLJ92388.1 hypothetical protein C8E06_0917 [Paracidovorax citrulli]
MPASLRAAVHGIGWPRGQVAGGREDAGHVRWSAQLPHRAPAPAPRRPGGRPCPARDERCPCAGHLDRLCAAGRPGGRPGVRRVDGDGRAQAGARHLLGDRAARCAGPDRALPAQGLGPGGADGAGRLRDRPPPPAARLHARGAGGAAARLLPGLRAAAPGCPCACGQCRLPGAAAACGLRAAGRAARGETCGGTTHAMQVWRRCAEAIPGGRDGRRSRTTHGRAARSAAPAPSHAAA